MAALSPGLYVPLITPFDDAGEVDLGCLERLAVRVLGDGATGLVVLATTAEASALSDGEREDVLRVASAVCADRGAPLLAGAGTNSTRTTIERHEALAAHASVTASLTVVPYYVRPSEGAIVRHYEAVAARSPVPVLAYNIPYRTGRGLGADAILELATIENVAGLKQAVGALDGDTLRVLAEAPEGFSVLAGDDAYVLPTLLMGGTGAITASAHVHTRRFAAMVAAGLAGDAAAARPHAEALLPVVEAFFAEPSPAVLKAVLHAAGELPTPDVRMPLGNATPPAVDRALAAVAASAPAPC